MEAASAPAKRITVGGVLNETFSIYGQHALALLGSAIVVSIGFILLIIPGLILITIWSVGAPAIVAEGAGPIEAFGRSWRLVRGDAWPVFGTLLVALVIVIVIGVVLG